MTINLCFGGSINIQNPHYSQINPLEFKHHLQHIWRFTGGTDCSDWTHGYNCWRLARYYDEPLAVRRIAFMHDWQEAVFADRPKPVKDMFPASIAEQAAMVSLDKAIYRKIYKTVLFERVYEDLKLLDYICGVKEIQVYEYPGITHEGDDEAWPNDLLYITDTDPDLTELFLDLEMDKW